MSTKRKIIASVAATVIVLAVVAWFMFSPPGSSVTTPASLAPGPAVSGGVASEYPVPEAPEPAKPAEAAKPPAQKKPEPPKPSR